VSEVETRRDGAVLTITLNRPAVLNAVDAAMHAALAAALEEASDPSVRAVLLTGAGRGFCAGQDLSEPGSATRAVADRLRERFNRHVLALRTLEKPVLAAVNGPAAGAGLALALACDVRLAAEEATFVPAFVRLGLAPDTGATWLARRLLGAARAFEWLATGRALTAAEALRWGLVSEVVPAAELPARALEVAELFAALPTRAVWETKRLLDAAETAPLAAQLDDEAWTQAGLVETADAAEGVAAFRERREPAFTGAAPERLHPVELVVRDDLRRFRLTVLLRLVLALPHLVVACVWETLAVPVAAASWATALARGFPASGLHAWTARFVRYWTHVYAYLYLAADPYPGFRGLPGTYPVDLDVAPPARQARWITLLRLPLAVPALVLAYVLSLVAQATALVAWFAALALGRVPRGMRDLTAYCLRFQAQTAAYLLLLTDRYPTLAGGRGLELGQGGAG
jgi:2-(1,2-epoxy-1,2-dihydrophenyl)acetyl-CoA isomerase